jgi:small subunit ribosomal protein S1
MQKNTNDSLGDENFTELLDLYLDANRGFPKIGDKLTVEVIAVTQDFVFVNTGTKIDGIVDRAELLDASGRLTCSPGDRLELFVVAADDEEIRLSGKLSGAGDLQVLAEAQRSRIPVEGRVTAVVKGGFAVEVMKRRAFCPVSQMDLKYVERPEDFVGESFSFRITRLEDKGRNIVLSRRELLAEEQEKHCKAFLAELAVGDHREGTVTRLMPFGAFVELAPGVEGMVHLSELSWSRIEAPQSVVAPGDRVTVKVIGMEPRSTPAGTKIALSVKQVGSDPWESAENCFKPGDLLKGRVSRCAPFGAFVEVVPGIEGLVHISEMSYTRRILKPEEVVAPGQVVEVMVKSVDAAKRRISLSLRDAQGDPWTAVPEKYPVGRRVVGRIEKKERFGYFVCLEPGVVGLLPASKLNRVPGGAEIEKRRIGDQLAVVVEALDPADRRISLAPATEVGDEDWQAYTAEKRSLSPLGDKLKAALDHRKKSGDFAG